jgi:hypothetical protein
MRWARLLVLLSAAVFAITGVGYVVIPGSMLAIVGVASTPTNDFLIRTEGVALLAGAGFLWAVHGGNRRQLSITLAAFSGYYVLRSVVDLAPFNDGVVGGASVPSAGVRIALSAICLLLAVRLDRGLRPIRCRRDSVAAPR